MARRKRPRAVHFESLEQRLVMDSDAELLVNVVTPRTQTSNIVGTAIDLNDRGDAVVVFSGKGPLDDKAVFFRRFPSGHSASDVVQVNQTTREDQIDPTVAIDNLGRFLVTWSGRGRDPRGLADQSGVFARWYNTNGTPHSDETLVNTTIGGVQKQSDVAVTPDGRAIVVWSGVGNGDPDGVYFQLYDANGKTVGSERRINQQTRGEQSFPSVAIAEDGSFIVSWSSRHQDGDGWGIFYRQFSAEGSAKGEERLASQSAVGSQFRSRTAADATGNFALVWGGYSAQSSWDVYLRRFDKLGIGLGNERLVNHDTRGHQQDPDIAMAPDGRFVISWTSGQPNATGSNAGSGWEVFGKLYDAKGDEISPDTPLSPNNGNNSGHQQFAAVAIGSGPELIASWSGRGQSDHGGVWIRQPILGLRPIFPTLTEVTLPEEQAFLLPIATRPAYEGQRIGLRLDSSDHPDGMVIDPTNARLLWTPSELDGPSNQYATIIAYDLDDPTRTTSQRVLFHILEVNRAPVLAPIPSQTIDEFESVSIQATGSDPDRPLNTIRYTLIDPPDPGMAIDPVTGRFTWQTNETDAGPALGTAGNRAYPIKIQATDNGSPNLSAIQTFTITVREADGAPTLTVIPNQIIREEEPFRLAIQATDPDDSNPNWNFRITGDIPSGLELNPSTGILSWTPTELQGPNSFPITLQVENLNQPGKSASQSFTIQVLEVNLPPRLDPIADRTGTIQQVSSVQAQATDPDLPRNSLVFSLFQSADPSATIDPNTGRFSWTPRSVGVYSFVVQVTDNGSPSLFDRESFSITVGDGALAPKFRSISDQVIDELTQLRFDAIADPSIPAQRIRYRLDVFPTSMSIDAVTGRVEWTPEEFAAPTRVDVLITAFDADRPTLFDQISVNVLAREVNLPPSLGPLAPVEIVEGETLLLQIQATDDDLPSNQLFYEIIGDRPATMRLDPLDTRRATLRWETTEADGPGLYRIPIRVTDNGLPSLSNIATLTITVLEENQPPFLTLIPDQIIDEQVLWTFDLQASDNDRPTQTLTYSLDQGSVAAGLVIDPPSGKIQWTPSEEQGPSRRLVTATATDNGTPFRSASRTFQIDVREVNRAPRIAPIPNQSVAPGDSLLLQLDATDPDLPKNNLSFAFAPALPPGATFDSATRTLRWSVPAEAATNIYSIRGTVIDDGSPNLSDFQDFTIEVIPKLIELVEEQRFATAYQQPITIQSGTQSLRVRVRDLQFDPDDTALMNDALELALVDSQERPVVGIIAPGRDAFFNQTESSSPMLGSGTSFDPNTGEVTVDVRHLPVGTHVRLIARLVNNDRDDRSRTTLEANFRQLATGVSASFATPAEPAPIADHRSNLLTEEVLRHLVDLSSAIQLDYELTTYDTDTDLTTAIVKLSNSNDYPIRGPVLIAIHDIDRPEVQVVDEAGLLPLQGSSLNPSLAASLRGAPFYDITSLLHLNLKPINTDDLDGNGNSSPDLQPGAFVKLQFRFVNTSNNRFRYQVTTLGQLNLGPTFTTDPNTTAQVDLPYTYSSSATDPDQDNLVYKLVAGPSGLSVDSITGKLSWTPSSTQVGYHQVSIVATDPFGLLDTQNYSIEVVKPTAVNRPPRFVTDPIIDAYVGNLYRYESRATDPDQDRLYYRIANGPSGLLILPGPSGDTNPAPNGPLPGDLTWTPSPADVGKYFPISLEVDDRRGGKGTQSYRIYVHPDPNNLPPVIVTEPITEFRIPQLSVGPSVGNVAPQKIIELLPREMSVTRDVSLVVPPNVVLPSADIALVVDESGSMQEQSWIAEMIVQLNNELEMQGVFESRFAIVGFGALDPKPRTVTDTPDFELLAYGPSGQLIQKFPLIDNGLPFQFTPNIPGDYSFVVQHKESFRGVREGVENRFFSYQLQASASSKTSIPRSGFGEFAGRVASGTTSEHLFSASAGDLIYVDGIQGKGVDLEILDPSGSALQQTRGLLSDSGVLSIPSSGQYRIRLSSFSAVDYRLRLLDPLHDGSNYALGTLVSTGPGNIPISSDPQALQVYRFRADAGSSLFVDRWLQLSGEFEAAVDNYSVEILSPDGSLYEVKDKSLASSFDSTLDIEPYIVNQTGDYSILLKQRSIDSEQPHAYQFVAGDVRNLATLKEPGRSVSGTTRHPAATEVYAYDLTQGDRISLNVDQVSGGGAVYRLLDKSGLAIHRGRMTDGSLFQNSSIRESGRYYLLVEGIASNTQTPNYKFQLSRQADQSIPPLSGLPIQFNELIDRTLHPSDPPARYQFSAQAGESLLINAGLSLGTFKLIAPSGGVLLSKNGDSNTGATRIASPVLFIAPSSGTYIAEFDSLSADIELFLQVIQSNRSPIDLSKSSGGLLEPKFQVGAFQWSTNGNESITLSKSINRDPFAYSTLAAGRGLTLDVSGGTEDGYDGIEYALNHLPFRENVPKHIILVTDEDRDIVSSASYDSIRDALLQTSIGLHSVVSAGLSVGRSNNLLGIAESGQVYRGFIEDGAGSFRTTLGPTFTASSPDDTTVQDYVDLTFDVDGTNWSLDRLRTSASEQNPSIRTSFTAALASELTSRIQQKVSLQLRTSQSQAPAVIGRAHIQGRTITYPVTLTGDGDAWNFDFEFYNRLQPSTLYGVVPAAIGAGYRYDVLAVDPDLDPITYRRTRSSDLNAQFDAINQTLLWSPTQPGSYSFAIGAFDDHGGSDSQTWTVTVTKPTDANRSPTLQAIADLEQPALRTLQLTLDASDPDRDKLTFQLLADPTTSQSPPQGLMLDPETGVLHWTPTRDQLGSHRVHVRVVDGRGGSAFQSFTIVVTPPIAPDNRRPVITSVPVEIASSRDRYRYDVVALDPDGDRLRYSLSIAPKGMTIDRDTGVIAWIPSDDDVGLHDVILRVADPLGAVTLQAFKINVRQSPPTRIISIPANRADLNQPFIYQVVATSRLQNDLFDYRILEGPLNATLDANGKLAWLANLLGETTFDIQVTSTTGESDTQRFSVFVVDTTINHPPSIDGQPRSSIPHSLPFVWQVPGKDPDRDPLTYSLDLSPTGMTLDADGWIKWTPTDAQITKPGTQPHEFRITLRDNRGGSFSKNFFIAVDNSAENHPPVLDGDPKPIAVANRTYQALFTATDVDADSLIWSLENEPEGMMIDSRGLVDWTPSIRDTGKYRITVRVTDIYGANDSKIFDLAVRAGNGPARIDGNPHGKHRRGTLYDTTFTATDPNGDSVTFHLLEGPSNAALDTRSGRLTWTPTIDGLHRFSVAAIDPFGEGSQLTFEVIVDSVGSNLPPRFENTDPGIAEVDLLYTRPFLATDPDGDAITYSVTESPSGMTIDASGLVHWKPTATFVNQSPTIQLTATDTLGQTASYRFSLPVKSANRPPKFDSSPSTSLIAGQTFRYDVAASDPDSDPLALKLLAAPSGLQFDEQTGRITWTTTASQIGSHNVVVTLTDSRIATPIEQSWTIQVAADVTAPKISIDASATQASVGEEIQFTLHGDDDVAIVRKSLTMDGKTIEFTPQNQAIFKPTRVGRFEAIATAIDAANNIATAKLEILVRDPNNAAPKITFLTPTGESAILAPTQVTANVVDSESDLTRVVLELRRTDVASSWRVLNSLAAAPGQRLANLLQSSVGLLDPTGLANGNYLLRITAEDAGFNQSSSLQAITIDGRLKIGDFKVSFTDLSIPVAGIPIEIIRTYDSLEAERSEDLGYGWKLEVAKATISVVDESLGGLGSGRYRAFVDGTRVLVKLPDGRTEGFTFRGQPGTQALGIVFDWKPGFVADEGNTMRLSVDAMILKKFNDEYVNGEGVTYNPQDPQINAVYQLKSIDRITHNIPARVGHTTSISDRNANTLTITDQGILSSRGRGLTFERDYLGRILRIVDPRGNAIQYGYSNSGDLTSFTDRMGNKVQYTYHSNLDHFIDKVIDPFGIVALEANYTPNDRRLSKLVDADGRPIDLTYDLNALTTVSKNPLGATESLTQDLNGNPLREIDMHGIETIREFPNPKQPFPTVERTVVGTLDSGPNGDDLVSRKTYNSYGQLLTETDPRGNATRYLYDGDGALYGVVDPNGVTNYYRYDEKENLVYTGSSNGTGSTMDYDKNGNLVEITTNIGSGSTGDFGGNGGHGNDSDSGGTGSGGTGSASGTNGVTTKFKYNTYGDLIETIDADSHSRTIEYDANGNQVGTQYVWSNPTNPNDKRTLKTGQRITPNDQADQITSPTGLSINDYDPLDRPRRSVNETGQATETIYDTRGLVIETRSQSTRNKPDGTSDLVWLVSRMIYDEAGNATYSTDAMVEGTPVAEQTGNHSIFDATGRATSVEQRLGVDIAIIGSPGRWSSKLNAAGRLVDSSQNFFDDQNRQIRSIDSFGTVSETFYDRWSQVLESRMQARDGTGALVWKVTRNVYDTLGRVTLTTDPYLVPLSTLLGTGSTPPLFAHRTEYDEQGRSSKSIRLSGVIVEIVDGTSKTSHPGQIISLSQSFYDDQGRMSKQIGADGQINETLYDSRGRAFANIGHPQPAETIGLGSLYAGKGVRLRSETLFDSNGQQSGSVTGILQVEEGDGKLIMIDRSQARTTKVEFDQLGRVTKTTFPDNSSTQLEYDLQGRVLAEIDQRGNRKQMQYDPEGRLTSVSLPAVPLVNNPSQLARPRWEYGYDGLGNLISFRDNLAEISPTDIRTDHNGQVGDDTRTTRFEFDGAGRQIKRTLPEGISESFAYDDRGRTVLHSSFEGVIERTIYDDRAGASGRLLRQEYFASAVQFNSGTGLPAEKIDFEYDGFGRSLKATKSLLNVASGTYAVTQITSMEYDAEGRLLREVSPTGNLNYAYDPIGRKTRTFTGYGATYSIDSASPLTDVRYRYDGLSRLERVETLIRDSKPVDSDPILVGNQPESTNYHFDSLGRMDYTELPNQIVEEYRFDGMDYLDSMAHYVSDNNNRNRSDNEKLDFMDYTNRIDGKRTSLVETYDFDHDNNPQTARVGKTTTYTWQYDESGRLTQESILGNENAIDRVESFSMDLVGNRVKRTIDERQVGAIDQAITYLYDKNDRLLSESQDLNNDGTIDQTTVYGWTGTQQAQKAAYNATTITPLALRSSQVYQYNLQGQLSSAIHTTFTSGSPTAKSRVDYLYDLTGIRISATEFAPTSLPSENWTAASITEYLVDHNNFTGYAQSVVETIKSPSGTTLKRTTYTFGFDELTQSTTEYDPIAQLAIRSMQLTFTHDAHGSVRSLYSLGAQLLQSYTYTAYGELLTIQSPTGAITALLGQFQNGVLQTNLESQAITNLLYSGESFDTRINQQYLRARWYTPTTARFDRLDPFAGDKSNPFSFHKYGYTTGDPIKFGDPSGLFEGLAGMLSSISISSQQRGTQGAGQAQAVVHATRTQKLLSVFQKARQLLDRLDDAQDFIETMIDFIQFDPKDVLDIANNLRTFDSFTRNIAGAASQGYFRTQFELPTNAVKKIRSVTRLLGKNNLVQEIIAETGMALVVSVLGFEMKWIRFHSVHGPDQIVYRNSLGLWGILEAKGGSSSLSRGSRSPRSGSEMSHGWINDSLEKIFVNSNDPDSVNLERDSRSNKSMLAAVFKLNVKARKFDVSLGLQTYRHNTASSIERWRGFY